MFRFTTTPQDVRAGARENGGKEGGKERKGTRPDVRAPRGGGGTPPRRAPPRKGIVRRAALLGPLLDWRSGRKGRARVRRRARRRLGGRRAVSARARVREKERERERPNGRTGACVSLAILSGRAPLPRASGSGLGCAPARALNGELRAGSGRLRRRLRRRRHGARRRWLREGVIGRPFLPSPARPPSPPPPP